MIGKLLQTEFSHIFSLEFSLKRRTILRLVTTCEHIGRIFINLQGRNQLSINFTHLDNPIEHMRQLLQLLIVTSTFLASPLWITIKILEIWINQYELSLANCYIFFSFNALILAFPLTVTTKTTNTNPNIFIFICNYTN